VLTGILPEFISTLLFDSLDCFIQFMAMAHFHVGYSLVNMCVDQLCPVLGIVDNLPGFVLAILYRLLGIPLGLQYLLYGLFSPRRRV
jgi:hypothetical protein